MTDAERGGRGSARAASPDLAKPKRDVEADAILEFDKRKFFNVQIRASWTFFFQNLNE